MLSLLDIAERIQKGPKMTDDTWNMGNFQKMNELTERYQLYYPKDNPVFNMDDNIADRAFQAAVDFMVEKGVYCLTTGRVIKFTREELLSTIKAMPKEVIVGEGKDTRVLKKRQIEEKEALNHCPAHHAPFTEDVALMAIKSMAEIPTTDYLEGVNFPVVAGREIYGLPMEVYGAKREAAMMREGVTMAGRPGLSIAYYPINTRAAAMIAPMDRDVGFRPCDGVLLSVLPDLKVEQDYVAAAIAWEEYGGYKLNGNGIGYVGGFSGGLGGAIIEAIAAVLTGWVVYRDIATWGCVLSSTAFSSNKELALNIPEVWGTSVYAQALCRNTNYIRFGTSGAVSGPGCENHLLEIAVRNVPMPINGMNIHITRQFRARMNASISPLDAEFAYEIAQAVMKSNLTRDTASDLVLKMNELLKGRMPDAPYFHINEFYDMVNHKPLPAFEQAYLKVKEKIAKLGLNLS
jgi:methylamine--corrinoid protein Co-methyltransferase